VEKLIFNEDVSSCIDNVYCKYYLFDTDKPIVIAFGSAGKRISKTGIKKSESPWAFDFIKRQNLNVICFAATETVCWYQSPIFKNHLKLLAKEISIFRVILGYGGSMGGYGVSAYSNTLNLTRALLLNPISTLQKNLVPFETRFGIDNKTNWEGIDGSEMDAPSYIVYDNLFTLDKKQAERYKNFTPLIISGVGHGTPETLSKMKMLKPLFEHFVKNTVDLKQFKLEAKKKRQIPRYYSFMLELNKDKMTQLRNKVIVKYRDENNIQVPSISKNTPYLNVINSNDIRSLRDTAILLEKTNINEAYTIMKIALKFRPTGLMMQNKVQEYATIIQKNKDALL
jgi:hypothetical protein